jgi:hypothetical protein
VNLRIVGRERWYLRLMELHELTATRQAARDMLDALLAAAGDGLGTPPVRINDEAVLIPAGLYDLLVRVIEEHGLDNEVQGAVDADYARQQHALRDAAVELGFDPDVVAPAPGRANESAR